MKKYYDKYKLWKHELIRKWAQRYADLIISQLEKATTEWEFDFWLNQGYMHDMRMVMMYDIYLD